MKGLPAAHRAITLLIALVTTVGLLACTTDPYTGERKTSKAAKGAGLGALVGAGVGLIAGGDAKGALIGAGIGALAGGAAGHYMDRQEAKLREQLAGTGVGVTRQGDNLILNMPGDITFDIDSSDIKPDFYRILGSVALVLKEFDKTSIHVVGFTAKPLAMLGPDLSLRALAEIQRRQGMAERVSSRHLERIRDFMATAENGKTLSLPLSRVLFRDGDDFWLGPEPGPRFPAAFRRELQPPEPLELPERGLRLSWRRAGGGKGEAGFDSFRVGHGREPLVARSPEPDRAPPPSPTGYKPR